MKTVDELAPTIFHELDLTDRIRVGYINTSYIIKRTLELADAKTTTPKEDRLTLWAHLVSMHAGIYGLDLDGTRRACAIVRAAGGF